VNRQNKLAGESTFTRQLTLPVRQHHLREQSIIPCLLQEVHMRRRLPVLAGFVVCIIGCSNEPFQIAPVSGRVTLDGKPVEKASVMFQPVATNGNINPGPGSYAITDGDGRYALKLIGLEKPGAAVGLQKVRIANFMEPGDTTDDRPDKKSPKPTVKIPGWYNRIDAILEFDVRPRNNQDVDFALSSKPPAAKQPGAK